MERLFGVSRTMTYVIIGASLIFIIGVINSFVNHREKTHYQIKSPDGTFYLTTEVFESDGCVTFIDEYKAETKVCGSYEIKKI
jgi:hypothetical protein